MCVRVLLLLLLWHIRPVRPAYSCLCSYTPEIPVFESTSASPSVLGVLRRYDCKPTYTVAVLDPDFLAIQFNGTVGYIRQDGSVQAQLCAGYPTLTDLVVPVSTASTTTTFMTDSSSPAVTTSRAPITAAETTTVLPTLGPTQTTETTTMPPVSSSTKAPITQAATTTVLPTSGPTQTTKPATMSPASSSTTIPTDSPALSEITTQSTTTVTPSTPNYCDPGWHSHANHCYLFRASSHDMLTWDEAQQECGRSGSQLMIIDTSEEQAYVHDSLQGLINPPRSDPKDSSLWIGATDVDHEGHWRWVDGHSKLHMAYTHWGPDEPNNQHDNEDCGVVRGTDGFAWNDYSCNNRQNYICEKPRPHNCATGWFSHDGHCYLFKVSTHDVLTWEEAQHECARSGSHLLFIETSEEQAYVHDTIQGLINPPHSNEKESSLWIGATDTDNEGHWRWVDGLTKHHLKYTHWGGGEPNNHHQHNEDCAVVRGVDGFAWNDFPCSYTLNYICEKTSFHND